jgi:hypothetical protein
MQGPIDSMLPPRWEYRKVLHSYLEDKDVDRGERRKQLEELNELGSEGWELAAAVPITGFDQNTSEIMYRFNRRAD